MENTIGGNIGAVREVLGFTQSGIARKIKASQSAVSQIEAGDRNPSFGMLLKIKRALGCEWAALLRGIQ
jgi:transcriptional regulator with XRE-family HTH domain